jgi:hypothetical protein
MPGVAALKPAFVLQRSSADFSTTPGLVFFYSYMGADCSDVTCCLQEQYRLRRCASAGHPQFHQVCGQPGRCRLQPVFLTGRSNRHGLDVLWHDAALFCLLMRALGRWMSGALLPWVLASTVFVHCTVVWDERE